MVGILPSNLVGLSVIHYVENFINKSANYHSWGIYPNTTPTKRCLPTLILLEYQNNRDLLFVLAG